MKKKILTAALLGSMVLAFPVSAEEDDFMYADSVFDMSTDYPGIFAKPGENTSFSLDFLNTTSESQDASLEIREIPENWEGFFKGKSGEISKVHVLSSGEALQDLASFSLSVPEDAQEGVYEIVLAADTDTGVTDEVVLEVNVSEQENGASVYTAEYPEQQAPSGTQFTFKTNLANNKGTAQSYSLAAETPVNWYLDGGLQLDS